MKTTRLFAAAIALLSVLSCQKEEQQVIDNSENEGGALITCTFANNDAATRTTVDADGLTPLWAEGDEIMLYDGSSKTQKLTLALSGTASSTEGIIDGTDATKFTFAKPSGWTKVYAIYPYSACVSGFSASDPKLNFAGQDGTFAKANICAAAEASGKMSFNNVGAILKFPSKPATVTNILIPVAGLAKDYKVSFSGTVPSLTSEEATNSNAFSIGNGTEAIYIGVPAGAIAKWSAFIYKDASNILGSYLTGGANTTVANKIHTLPAMEANGKLPGLFTVSAGTDGTAGTADDVKVQFTKGNLYWDGSAFKYESTQTAYISSWNTSHVGHFYWSKSAPVAYAKTYSDSGASTNDAFFFGEGNSFTIDGQSGLYALSSAEWTYLLSTRGTGDSKFKKGVTVNGAENCLVIASDGYAVNIASSYDADAWSTAEASGLVCLPAAGFWNGSQLFNGESFAIYWSATLSEEGAYGLCFNGINFNPANLYSRDYGSSVRLVCAAQ